MSVYLSLRGSGGADGVGEKRRPTVGLRRVLMELCDWGAGGSHRPVHDRKIGRLNSEIRVAEFGA